jgi:hypothetical protein
MSSRALALQHARAPRAPRRATVRHHTCARQARDPRSERRAPRNVSPATRRVSPRRPDSPTVALQVRPVPSLPRARLPMHCCTATLKPRHPFAAKAWSRTRSPVYKWHRPSSLAPEPLPLLPCSAHHPPWMLAPPSFRLIVLSPPSSHAYTSPEIL